MALIEFLGAMLFSEAARTAIGQNLVASVLYDVGKDYLKLPFPQRWTAGKLPVNHDLERTSTDCLRRTLQFCADSLATELGKPRSRIDRILGLRVISELLGGAPPSSEDRWIDRFIKAIWDEEKLAKLSLSSSLPVEDLAKLFSLTQSGDHAGVARSLHESVDVWAREHAGSPPPALWVENLRRGFRAEKAAERRVTLFEVWLMFLREALKSDDRPFRAFVVESMARLRESPSVEGAGLPLGDEELASRALASWGTTLDQQLREQQAWMGEQFALVRQQQDELLSGNVLLNQKIDSLHQSVADHQQRMELLVREVRDALATTRTSAPAASPASETKPHPDSADTGAGAGAGAPAKPGDEAVRQVAERLQVEPEAVELTLNHYASAARRQSDAPAEEKALGKAVEKEFNVKPATTNAPPSEGCGGILLRLLALVLLSQGLKKFNQWLNPPIDLNPEFRLKTDDLDKGIFKEFWREMEEKTKPKTPPAP